MQTGECPLDLFLPPVASWFRQVLGQPTRIQELAWPVISQRDNALLLASTGSGKTLAAFLACLDRLWREPNPADGVRILYISPLKALNNDIHRNLGFPLQGIIQEANESGFNLEPIRVGVRTGDTPPDERRALIRRPPSILITTPESLHLLLTSNGRDSLRNVETVILDEIHSLCPNKRGAFLSLLLERLEAFRMGLPANPRKGVNPLQRIGLSATQRPLEEVARFLGGITSRTEKDAGSTFRPVTILDAGHGKKLDIAIHSANDEFPKQAGSSIWPALNASLRDLVEEHQSTLVFANNRRGAEKITAGINEGADSPRAFAHHGSISLERRRAIEEGLKEGKYKAVVATASMEMGIDMGSVDLVAQVESPGMVSTAIQRIGRAGHSVGKTSKARFLPKTEMDLLELAAILPMVHQADIEALRVPDCPLDILAQQVISAVAVDPWPVHSLLEVLSRAYPYRELTSTLFEDVLDMVSGRFRLLRENLSSKSGEGTQKQSNAKVVIGAFQPKIHWDRALGYLEPLPGTKANAIAGGGAIPDTGNYPAICPDGSKVGELDEEFVYERRAGEAFLLGTTVWRIEAIESNKVLVTPAPGASAVLPFWRGEGPGRSLAVGQAMGRLLRAAHAKIDAIDRLDWLERDHFMDRPAARNFFAFLTSQTIKTGFLPTDEEILVDCWRDPLGDWQIAIITLLGSRFNHTLRLALEQRLNPVLGYQPAIAHHDDGVLIRLTDTENPPENPLAFLDLETLREDILLSLSRSPLFAIRFRQNAARSLIVQRASAGKRAPLWLQRLRGRDLLQVLGNQNDFPLVTETYRECLAEHLEVDAVRDWLKRIATGKIAIRARRGDAPSPFAREITWQFTAANLYQPDEVTGETKNSNVVDKTRLESILGGAPALPEYIHPDALKRVDLVLRLNAMPPRSPSEMGSWLLRIGDLTEQECGEGFKSLLENLVRRGSALRFQPNGSETPLVIATELQEQYLAAFGPSPVPARQKRTAIKEIVRRHLDSHTLVQLDVLCKRYPLSMRMAKDLLEEWVAGGSLMEIPTPGSSSTVEYAAPENWQVARKITLGIARREFSPVDVFTYCDFLLAWQGFKGHASRSGAPSLDQILNRMQIVAAPISVWENGILANRLISDPSGKIDTWLASGQGSWIARNSGGNQPPFVSLWNSRSVECQKEPELGGICQEALGILELLGNRGALFLKEISKSTGLTENKTSTLLRELALSGLVTNDRLSPLRLFPTIAKESSSPPADGSRRTRLASLRESFLKKERDPEGRWSKVQYGDPDLEELSAYWAVALLDQFGILTKEIVEQFPDVPPWKNLYSVLDHLELTGEIRRGLFVEGFKGAQFALPEALDQLSVTSGRVNHSQDIVFLHFMDPANLYGPGRLLSFQFTGQGNPKGMANDKTWVALHSGRPVAVVWQDGRDIDFLTTDENLIGLTLKALVDSLSKVVKPWLKVETCDQNPAGFAPWRERLEKAGMVADHRAMAYHAKIPPSVPGTDGDHP